MYTAFGIKEVLYVAEIPDGGPQTTPESSRCAQSFTPRSALLQYSNELSFPKHWTLSIHIGPVPFPNDCPFVAAGYWWMCRYSKLIWMLRLLINPAWSNATQWLICIQMKYNVSHKTLFISVQSIHFFRLLNWEGIQLSYINNLQIALCMPKPSGIISTWWILQLFRSRLEKQSS